LKSVKLRKWNNQFNKFLVEILHVAFLLCDLVILFIWKDERFCQKQFMIINDHSLLLPFFNSFNQLFEPSHDFFHCFKYFSCDFFHFILEKSFCFFYHCYNSSQFYCFISANKCIFLFFLA
jgi:hypothetical protein